MGCLMRFYRWLCDRFELDHYFFHFIWLILPKKYEMFKKVRISYVVLPQFLLRDRRRGGMAIYRKSPYKVMIFVVNSDPFKRYTIWHEYRENRHIRANKTTEQIIEAVSNKIRRNFVYQIDTSSKEFSEDVRKWVDSEGEYEHFEAFVDELILASKEMTRQDFQKFLKYRLRD